ncbi:ATP synthase F1 subunit gamma [Myxococcota bacterium]|nr:ATP synthase F1 subunit gamma [Myxococcota bacterium]MCZ7617349.1 ATP synthase F1 subunit gamma [Myxococcota bacterium]
MPSLKDIRRRITSVKKTQQITRAMRMVAAAKLRRAQTAIESARPYADRMRETLREVAASGVGSEQPLLQAREHVKHVDVIVVTSDRGLCGAFNTNVLKRAQADIAAREADAPALSIVPVGRKSAESFRRRRAGQVVQTFTGIARVEYAHAVEIARYVTDRFLSGASDEVLLIHSEFVSTMTQRPRCSRILPMVPEDDPAAPAAGEPAKLPYKIEPDAESLLRVLAPKALEVEIYRALLDNQAGEHAARMTSMESATRNTEEMISALTLQYNRARQAAITKELVEIVSGAEAL